MRIGDLAKELQERHELSEDESRKLAQLAGGRVGTAMHYLRDEEFTTKSYHNDARSA